MNIRGRCGQAYGFVNVSGKSPRGTGSVYFPGPLEAQEETLGYRRGFLADGLVTEPL